MSLTRRMLGVLTAVGIVSSALLVGVNAVTKGRIAANKQKEIEAAVTMVVPGTTSSQKVYEERGFSVYAGKNESGKLLGYAVNASIGGFQDIILFLVGTNADLTKIHRLYILEQKETPGLGAKITDEKTFLQFWEDRDCHAPLLLRKPPVAKDELGPSEVNAVTGATVSSESVLSGVNSTLEKMRKLRSEGKLPLEVSGVR